jgi:hypothetical protein
MLTMGDDLFAALTRLQAGLDTAFEVQGMVAHRRRRLKCFRWSSSSRSPNGILEITAALLQGITARATEQVRDV